MGGMAFPIRTGRGSVSVGCECGARLPYAGAHVLGLFGASTRLRPTFTEHLERVTVRDEQLRRERALGLDHCPVRVWLQGDESGMQPPVGYELDF